MDNLEKYDLDSSSCCGEDISEVRSFVNQELVQTEESLSDLSLQSESVCDLSLQEKGHECDARIFPESEQDKPEKCYYAVSKNLTEETAEDRCFTTPEVGGSENYCSESVCVNEELKSCEDSDSPCLENYYRSSNQLSTKKGNVMFKLESGSAECDTYEDINNSHKSGIDKLELTDKDFETEPLQGAVANNDHKGDSNTLQSKEGKYFYYDKPHYEETGSWIPVSIPPMSETEHDEWTKGFCSNGGYLPDGDSGWTDCGDDKELTMWDVVVEMLLAARGKVTALGSGDITQLSWISGDLIEHAWKEMAQTLTEANSSNAEEILESEPPKWLPDSAASSCMLCSVRFHPIMCTRHHCRFCGGIFCSECTKGKSLLPENFRTGDPQRVCDVCCVRLESVQPYLMGKVSRAAQLPTHDLTDLSTLRSWVNFPWGQSMEYEIYKATNTIRSYMQVGYVAQERRIPEAILRNAKGLAILTVVKVGMMVTYNVGTGLVVARRDDGSWSPPSAIASFGVGWGAQAGGELTDFIIVLRTNGAVKTFSSHSHFSVGAGLSAAIGITGRTAEADMRAGTSGYAACYTYSCSKGAFIGCSLEGSMVTTRARENSRFYGSQSINASDILLGSLPRPPAAASLYRALSDLYMQLQLQG